MKAKILDLIDFEKVDTLLEGFNQSTGFVTAILDLEGNVLSKSGWRQICTEFHRIHPETARKCLISDTELANKMAEGENYHFYQCLNGLVDVAVPIVIKGEHVANLFSGQFFFEEPDESFFQEQATKYQFNKESYRNALKKVPVVSKGKVIVAMDFLLNMTQMISEMTFQKLEQMELNEAIKKNEHILRLFVEHSPASIAMFDNDMRYLVASNRFKADYNLGDQSLIGRSHYEVFPEISERWKEFHRRGLAGDTLKEDNDIFPRVDGKTDWVRWEIRPWYEAENKIGGIILFSEVITAQIEDRETLRESEKYNRMLFEQSAIGLALTSLDGKLVDINPAFANIIGRTIEETKSLTYWEITPEKYQHQEQEQLESLAKTGKYGPYEKEYIHKDGHLVPVRLQGLIIDRNNGKFIWSSVEDITERKLAETKLLANNKLLTDTLESMSDAFVSLDRNWCYTYMNEKAGVIFGRNPKEMIGKNIWTEFPEGVGQPFQLNYEKAMNEKVFIRMEEYYPPYNMWFENRINPTDDGIAIFFQDITERKLAEEKLKQSETQYRNLIEQAADGIILADTNGNIRKVNSAFCAMLGYSEEELLKLNLSESYLPEERDLMSIRLSEIGESDSIRFEWNMIRKDKSIIPVEAIIAKTSHGLTQGIVRDISERKQTEMLLTESERKYRYLFENNPLPMWIYDLQTLKFLEVNEAAIIHYGYTKEEFLSMSLKDIRPIEDVPDLEKDVESTHYAYNKAGFWRHKKKNGEIIFVEIISHLIDFDGTPSRLVLVNDVTERKRAEKELEFKNSELQTLNRVILKTSEDLNLKFRLESILDEALQIVGLEGGTICLVKPDNTFELSAHRETSAETIIDLTTNQIKIGDCLCGNCALDCRPLILNTPDEVLKYATREVTRGEDIRFHAAMPFIVQGKCVGVLCVFTRTDKKPDDRSLKLLETICAQASVSVESARLFENLHQSEELLRLSTELANVAAWELDIANDSVSRSKNHDHLFGLENQESWHFDTFMNATHPNDREMSKTIIQNSLAIGGPDECQYDFRVVYPDQSVHWLNVIGQVTKRDAQGKGLLVHGFLIDITERKKAEEALRKSQERFRVAQEFSPDGFTILHPLRNEKKEIVDFTWVYENQTIARINKTNPEDVIGKRLLDLFPTHKGTTVFETYIHVANSGKPKILEEVYVGEVVSVPTWLRLVVVPMEEDIAILAQDITERKNAELELIRITQILKNAQEIAHLGSFEFVAADQSTLWSEEEYRIYGLDPGGPSPEYNEMLENCIHPDDAKLLHETFMKAMQNHEIYELEHRIIRPDSSVKWVHDKAHPFFDDNGKLLRYVGATLDITESKQKEQEIIKLNQRLEILIESIQQLSATQSIESVQDIVAKSARKLIGADGATLVFREDDHCSYVNEDAIQPLWKGKKFPMSSCISGWVMLHKKPVIIEDIFTDDRIPQDVYSPTFVKSLAMVPININEPIGAIGNYWKEKYTPTETEMQLLQTLADSASRAIENINLYAGLEERVKQRTEQLHAVNKELETFTYSVSHDLKAPLRGIDGYSKLLLDEYGDSLNEEAAHFIKTIRSSTLQMNRLIEDLLAYSRLERSRFKQERIALKSFVETLVSNFSEEIKKERFIVEINIPEVEFVTDPTGLSIVLRNFIENAIKFTAGRPNPLIEIGLDDNQESWIINVKDNGVGFDMKYHNRIFEIFQRLHRAEDFPGTGIGLAMVAKAAHRMNGKTRAESIPGQGSVFFIEIPKNISI